MALAGFTVSVIILLFCTLLPIVTAIQQFLPSTDVVEIGLTRSLQMECTFKKDSTIALTSSLTIFFSSITDQPVFYPIASVSSAGIDNSSGAVDSGVIASIGTSKLSLSWNYPTPDLAGVYKCEARGTLNGVQKTKYLTFEITAAMPSQETFLQYFQQLTHDFEDLKASSAEDQLLLSELNDRLDRGISKFFRVSDAFQGRRYYLSADSNNLVTADAEAMCEIFGGYLVEIDNADEYQFILTFLKVCLKSQLVLTGGSDEALENNWVNNYSKTPVRYINWGSGQPGGGRGENCLYFFKDASWKMADYTCCKGVANYIVSYLCEIPE